MRSPSPGALRQGPNSMGQPFYREGLGPQPREADPPCSGQRGGAGLLLLGLGCAGEGGDREGQPDRAGKAASEAVARRPRVWGSTGAVGTPEVFGGNNEASVQRVYLGNSSVPLLPLGGMRKQDCVRSRSSVFAVLSCGVISGQRGNSWC